MEEDLDKTFSKYLSDEMSSKERKEFEGKLAQDENLKLEFDNYRLGMIAGKRLHYNELKGRVSAIIEEENAKGGKKTIIKRMDNKAWLVAASILILAPITIYFISNASPDNEALFASYYEEPGYSTSRGAAGVEKKLEDALLDYSKSKWQEVINQVNEMDEPQKSQDISQKLLAHSLLNMGKEREAISKLKQFVQKSSSESMDDLWYIGLAYLKSSELDSSLVYLEKINDGNHFNDAKDLIKKIKRKQ